MGKSTPHFNDMIAARGGAGASSTGGAKGGKMPKPVPAPKKMPASGKAGTVAC